MAVIKHPFTSGFPFVQPRPHASPRRGEGICGVVGVTGFRDRDLWTKIVAALDADANQSDRQIAAAMRCEHHVVGRVRREWIADADALRLDLRDPAEMMSEAVAEILQMCETFDGTALERELKLRRTSDDPVPPWARGES